MFNNMLKISSCSQQPQIGDRFFYDCNCYQTIVFATTLKITGYHAVAIFQTFPGNASEYFDDYNLLRH